MHTFVETMCNEFFLSKSPEGALLYFDVLAEGAQNWNTYTDETKGRSFDKGGLYQVSKGDDIELKFLQLSKKVEAMESNKPREGSVGGSSSVCVIGDKVGCSTEDCHTIPAFREVFINLSQVNAMNSYNQPPNDPYS